jgi:hypothetical protein
MLFPVSLVVGYEAQTQLHSEPQSPRLRVAIVGLVHGHVSGFFSQSLPRTDIEVVGIFEPDRQIFYAINSSSTLIRLCCSPNLEEMLQQTRPQAVLVYTNTGPPQSKRCARDEGSTSWWKNRWPSARKMPGPSRWQQSKAEFGAVNYGTTWYPSNRAAYDLIHQKAIGEIRKVVATTVIVVQKRLECSLSFLPGLPIPN